MATGSLKTSFCAVLSAMLLAVAGVAAWAQDPSHAAESPQVRQLHQALKLADHGDQQGAMNLVLSLLEQHPNFVPALNLKGMLLEDAGRTSEAGAAYEAALKLAPNDGDLLLKAGIYKLASGQKEEAVKLLEHCIRILPHDGDAQYYLAQAYHLTGQDGLALRAIQQSLKAEPDNVSVWQKYGELLSGTGDSAAGLKWLLKAQHSDASLPRIDYDIAAANYKLMDLAAAAQYAARAVQAQPNDMKAWQLLALANAKLAKWQEAKQAFEHILAFQRDDVDSLLGLGQCELELKNYSAAVDRLQSVLRLDPTRLLAHFYLSRAFAAMGRTADAEHEAALHQLMMEQKTFVRSAESDEREGPIKGQARQLLAEHREADTLHLYQEHFKGTAATLADAYVFAGKLYLFMGQTEDGERCLHRALEIQPTVRGAHTYQGILALKQSDLNRAENEFQAELRNDPNYQTAIAEMGEVRYHQGRYSDAADRLAKSRTTTPELLYMLCDSYFRTGKVSDANLTAETIAAYGRNNPRVMKDLLDLLYRNGQAELAQRLSADLMAGEHSPSQSESDQP
jgi:tetratricopeptide (TPR) repeat protein